MVGWAQRPVLWRVLTIRFPRVPSAASSAAPAIVRRSRRVRVCRDFLLQSGAVPCVRCQTLERGFTNSRLIELPCTVRARRPNHRSFACSKPSCACAPSCTARRIFDPQPQRLTVEPGVVFEATGGDSKSQAAILLGGGLANLAWMAHGRDPERVSCRRFVSVAPLVCQLGLRGAILCLY